MASCVTVLLILLGAFVCALPLPARGSAADPGRGGLGVFPDPVAALPEQSASSEHSELPQTKPLELVTAPKVLYEVEPEYSEEARRAHFQGTVVLYVEVDTGGKARNIRVVRRLGLGLDEKAVEAVSKWKFQPGMKGDRPVTVAATIEVSFRLLRDFELLLRQARQGDVGAQFHLARMFELGGQVPQDYGAAVKWYREAAERGVPAAQNNLGLMHEKGHGLAQDYRQAMKWYRKGADGGNAEAQSNLGQLYEKGHGVAQDYRQALRWFSKAAEQGLARAQYNLGSMYYGGQGMQQDYSRALEYYHSAAEQGLPAAQYAVGLMLADGQGTLQDRVSAHMWFELAESGQDVGVGNTAAAARAAMAKTMTREEIAEARRLAKEWHPAKP